MAEYRAARASQRIQQEISLLFEREVSDPRLTSVNITRVEVSGDLRYAKIFVAPIRDDADATRAMMSALDRATGFFRRRIATSLDLRVAPEVRFLVDRSIEKGERFLRALEEIRKDER
ncbi:MAG: 30S ribosome-binding factor RbfA [Chloroflexi bacterium]|nr:30S ribosome-binding factor RbfA [Chloroflexota bacterium]